MEYNHADAKICEVFGQRPQCPAAAAMSSQAAQAVGPMT